MCYVDMHYLVFPITETPQTMDSASLLEFLALQEIFFILNIFYNKYKDIKYV